MAAALNPLGTPEPALGLKRRRGRLQLLAILLVVVGPMVLATFMYKFQFWVPSTRVYHGELIGNGQSRADLGVVSADRRWQLLVTSPGECAADCQQLVYLARQLQIGLGRDASRASHALASAVSQGSEYEARLAAEYPRLQRLGLDVNKYRPFDRGAAQLWIVDPHGNLVLRYGSDVNGKDLLQDLRLLLKLSNIG